MALQQDVADLRSLAASLRSAARMTESSVGRIAEAIFGPAPTGEGNATPAVESIEELLREALATLQATNDRLARLSERVGHPNESPVRPPSMPTNIGQGGATTAPYPFYGQKVGAV